MGKASKRFKEIHREVDVAKVYSLDEAIALFEKVPSVKFDESMEVAFRMGIDPKKSDQQVRSTVALPHGTGKKIRVLALVKGDKVQEALDAGADEAGSDEFIEKIKGGWTNFDAVVTTPDMMRDVGKLGKVLGPRNLMPTPKAGTVTLQIGEAVKALKAGQVEFKVDKSGVINNIIGKKSFSQEQLKENLITLFSAISRAKPATAKGQYIKSLALSSTMGPGVQIDLQSIPQS